MDFFTYLGGNYNDLLEQTLEHALIVLVSVAIGSVIGLALGVLTYRRPRQRTLVLSVTGVFLTIPSLALFSVMVSILGLGTQPVIIALTMYSLLPIVRNTVTGLLGVDQAVVESAQGMGMGRWQRLRRIELPLAWPVILTGIRVSTMVLVGIAAIGAIVNGGGLGQDIFAALARVGSPAALNLALGAFFAIILLGAVLDALFLLLSRATTSRGIR